MSFRTNKKKLIFINITLKRVFLVSWYLSLWSPSPPRISQWIYSALPQRRILTKFSSFISNQVPYRRSQNCHGKISVVDPEPAFYLTADPNPDPDQENFYIKTIRTSGNRSKNIPTKVQKPFWKARNQVYLWSLVNFDAPGSGSASAFPIRLRIQDSQMNADPQHRGYL